MKEMRRHSLTVPPFFGTETGPPKLFPILARAKYRPNNVAASKWPLIRREKPPRTNFPCLPILAPFVNLLLPRSDPGENLSSSEIDVSLSTRTTEFTRRTWRRSNEYTSDPLWICMGRGEYRAIGSCWITDLQRENGVFAWQSEAAPFRSGAKLLSLWWTSFFGLIGWFESCRIQN